MRITSLRMADFRSFVESGAIPLGQINVFVGPNNAGKSSILRAAYTIQGGVPGFNEDVRIDAEQSIIQLTLADINAVRPWANLGDIGRGTLLIEITRNGGLTLNLFAEAGGKGRVNALPAQEPDHFVVPYLSRRKAVTYQENVSEQYALQVAPQFDYLAAKLSRLGNFAFPAGERYRETCHALLGFVVTAVPSPNGQRPGVYLEDRRTIPLTQMGEGVPNIVGLLADLALSQGKLFLVEEPENDLHPQALKSLLDLILVSAESNQFLVSTHSNIVTRHLGAAPGSRLFYVDSEPGSLPAVANVQPVDTTPEARLAVLRELGYAFSDLELWDGWLILEESSAERIIRDYLVPLFVPKLTRVRTLAAGGNTQVEPTFEDFHRLVRFTHLEDAYRNTAWVRIDGDDAGARIVERLRSRYPSWSPDRFACFSEPKFERYYPSVFRDRVADVLGIPSRRDRRAAKARLLGDVRDWLDEDENRARGALAESAEPVIADLSEIATQL